MAKVDRINEGIQQLCETPDNTKNCFKTYLRTIVDDCLEGNETIINLTRLQPMEQLVNDVCAGENLGKLEGLSFYAILIKSFEIFVLLLTSVNFGIFLLLLILLISLILFS